MSISKGLVNSADREYRPIDDREPSDSFELISTVESAKPVARPRYTQRLSFRRMLTRNVVLTLASHFLLALHLGTFNALWFIFLSTPVWDPSSPNPALPKGYAPRPPFVFTGGLGLPPSLVGIATAIFGVLGILLQLTLYAPLSARLGTVASWRVFLALFPLAYFSAPYLAQVPSSSPPPQHKSGAIMWVAVAAVLLVQVLGRTFTIPAQTILVNNCSPHPSVLASLHGLAQSVSSAARTLGPVLGAEAYGRGLDAGVVGAVWWALSGVAVVGFAASWKVKEGNGHEIWLEGDYEDA